MYAARIVTGFELGTDMNEINEQPRKQHGRSWSRQDIAVAVLGVVLLAANIFPGYAIANRAEPILLGMPFGMFWIVPAGVLAEPDQILPHLVTNVLPVGGLVFGLIGAGALAAAMSSADAITHGASVTFTRDVVYPFRPGMSEAQQVWMMRGAVVVVGAFAYYLLVPSRRPAAAEPVPTGSKP